MKACQYLSLLLLCCLGFYTQPGLTDNEDTGNNTLRFSGSEIKPFLFRQQNGELTGLTYDIIVAICEEIDVTPTFVLSPFRRSFLDVTQGNTDGMLVLRIPGHDKTLFPNLTLSPEAIVHQRVFVIGLAPNDKQIDQLEDLSAYHVGHIRLLPELHKILIPASGQKSLFNNTRQLIKALLARRIDVAIVSPSMIPDINAELSIEGTRFIKLYEYPLQPITMAWTQHDQQPEFIDMIHRFDQAIIKFRKSGRIKKIIARYLDPALFVFEPSADTFGHP